MGRPRVFLQFDSNGLKVARKSVSGNLIRDTGNTHMQGLKILLRTQILHVHLPQHRFRRSLLLLHGPFRVL